MVKLIQAKEHEVLIAMSFWALGHPITFIVGFVLSGLKATSDDKKVLSVSTTMVDGLVYGPANLLLTGVTVVLNMICYAYIRYALKLQMKVIPTTFTVLYFIAYVGLALLFVIPPVKLHIPPYNYGGQYIGFQIFMIFSIAWLAYFSQWLKSSGGRACFIVGLALAGVLLLASWVVAASTSEESSAPFEWSSTAIITAYYAFVVFICERDKVMKLNSNGFSNLVSNPPQEYEQF